MRIDLGGQGSTDIADGGRLVGRVGSDSSAIIPALAALGVAVSVDTWRPEVARRALDAGATVLNAADGMQTRRDVAGGRRVRRAGRACRSCPVRTRAR